MRWWPVLAACLAACGGAKSTAPRDVTDSRGMRARVELARDGLWVDIAVSGPADQTRTLCERAVATQLQLQGRLARPCAPDPLPRVPHDGAVLVETDRVRGDDMTLGTQPAPDATARVETFQPFADRAICEQTLARLNADDIRRREDGDRARVDDLARRRQAATDERDRACGQVAEEEAKCAAHHGEERTQCDRATEPKRVVCRDMTRRREELERPPPPAAPPTDRVCR